MTARFRLAWIPALALGLSVGGSPALVRADVLHTRASLKDGDVVQVEELSYEAILDVAGAEPTMSLRVTLHNASDIVQDARLMLALPRGATLERVRVNRGSTPGQASTRASDGWMDGLATGDRGLRGERPDGTVLARLVPSAHQRGLPSAEVVAFAMASHSTMQVELGLGIVPTLRAGRWELDLPRRHNAMANLVGDRRVIVRGLPRGDPFYVDTRSNGGEKVLITRANDTVTVAWPARLADDGGSGLRGSYQLLETLDSTSGRFRISLRLADDRAARPDHVVLLVDRSRSSSRSLQRSAGRVLAELLDALPSKTTFEVVGFDRNAAVIAEGSAGDDESRVGLIEALDTSVRGSGTDLRPAMRMVGARLALRAARRPLVMVISDGMLPGVPPAEIRAALEAGLGDRAAPEFLFVVDDPLFSVGRLSPDSTVATLASHLGARIAVRALVNVRGDDVDSLLASPRVLGELDLRLPPTMQLDRPVTHGLIAGQRLVIEGSYEGRAPSAVTVRGKLGTSSVSSRLPAKRRAAAPAAFVLAGLGEEPEDAAVVVFALPTWLTHRLEREGREGVDAVSGDGVLRRGSLDADIIHRYIGTRVMPRALACYNTGLTRNRSQSGRFVYQFELGKGEVMLASLGNAELQHDDSALLHCLGEAAWKLEIPAGHLDGQTYLVRYPVRLNPPGGEQPASTSQEQTDDTLFQIMMQRADVLSR